jgi:hypothetical protein
MKNYLKLNFRKAINYFNLNIKTTNPYFSSYFKNSKLNNSDYHRPVLSLNEGNILINTLLKSSDPFLICRFGDIELSVVSNYLCNIITGENTWNDYIKETMWGINGTKPINDDCLVKFAKTYLDNTNLIDVLAVWNNRGEDFVTRFLNPNAELIYLKTLEPFFFASNPWSRALEGKKVLVVHPYEASIQKQYLKHQILFNNIFPSFELITYKPFNVIMHNQITDFDWFSELDKMKMEISNLSFDVALVAAGPFGFPLSAHIKKIGKQAIHVGGALQLFFGIKGRRWENREQSLYFNEHWIYPSNDETPSSHISSKVDNGDYWK